MMAPVAHAAPYGAGLVLRRAGTRSNGAEAARPVPAAGRGLR
jgi:hypothetical protein